MLNLKVDYRLGGKPRYYLAEEEEKLMQVPDEIKKCIVFLACNTNKGIVLGGTAFFVAVALEEFKERNVSQLVTARHVIDEIRKVTIDNKVYIRANMLDGTAKLVASNIDDWIAHKDISVDVAILPWSPPQNEIDFLPLGYEMGVTEKIIKDEGIGAGDEVFLTGLFYNHYGKKRNIPIIRGGNIAMLPDEKIYVGNDFGDMEAYLVESRSIGGLSGSPVFVYMGGIRIKENSLNLSGGVLMYWLGLMHGHWNIDKKKADAMLIDKNDREELHSGIAVVVPASKIVEVLFYDNFVEKRKKIEQKYKEEHRTTQDSAIITSNEKNKIQPKKKTN